MHIIDAIVRDCFNAIIELRRWTVLDNGLAPSFATAHSHLRTQIDKMIGHALACGISRSDVQTITYAMAAFADSIATKGQGTLAASWREEPLVAHYVGDRHSQDGFFERLDAARQQHQDAVLRVFAMCLALGYRGRMRPADAARALATLRTLIETPVGQRRSQSRLDALPATALEPAEARPWHLFWVPVGAALVCVALYVMLSSTMRSDAAAFAGWIDALLRV